MAVKLILVVLVLAVVSSSLAQQSEQSGGQKSDRRLALRRFRNRNRDNEKSDEVRENRRQNPRKLANQEEIIKRRKELLQRNNITRRKNFSRKPTVNEVEDETTKRTVRIKSPSVEEDVVVEKISNNDRDIISKVLNQAEAGQDGAPFSGKSEVRTLSAPSGFRSSNEQITRISFKRPSPTTSKPEEEEVAEGRIPGRNPVRSRLASARRVISRQRQTDRAESTTSRVLLLSQASPALKALLATANDAEKAEPTEEREKPEENLSEDAQAAIREMHEDNREEDVPVNPRGRQRGDRRRVRVNLRGRPAGGEEDKPRSSSSNRFRSFPARENGGGRTRGSVVTARPRQEVTTTTLPPTLPPTEAQRFQTRPTPASTTESVFGVFQGFDFPAPIPVRPQAAPATVSSLQEVTEVPSQFTLQQTLGAAAAVAPVAPQQQPRAFPAPAQTQQFQPQQFQPQQFQPQQFSTEIKPFVHHLPGQSAQPTPAPGQAPVSVNRFQSAPAPATQTIPASQPQFNSFNLLNSNNFAAFDAQFGGSVPTNNGVSQLSSSNIFAQPGNRLLQGNDVIVNAPSVFAPFGQTNLQSGAFRTG